MTLTTHAVAGAALASLMPEHPLVGFAAGFASHFMLDAIPHWDYAILSASVNPEAGGPVRFDRRFALDMVRIGSDATLGLALSALLIASPENATAVFWGAVGGILPDALQFAYLRFPQEPLLTLQRLHWRIHAKRRLEREGRFVLGLASQLALLGLIIAGLSWFS